MEKQYYPIRNKNLAITISWLLGEDFLTFDDKFNEGKKYYSFRNTEKFQEILTLVSEIRK